MVESSDRHDGAVGRRTRQGTAGTIGSRVAVMTDQPKARILVVDDEQMLLDMVSDALTFAGYDISAAPDGIE